MVPKVEVVHEVGEVTRIQTSQDATRKPEPPHDLAATQLVKNDLLKI